MANYDVHTPRYVQDMPPPGGFPKVDYNTHLRSGKGPSGAKLFSLVAVSVAVGLTVAINFQKSKMHTEAEKKQRQLTIAPLLQAEADRRYVEAYKSKIAEEEAVMKGVPGWVVGESVYHSKKWTQPIDLQHTR